MLSTKSYFTIFLAFTLAGIFWACNGDDLPGSNNNKCKTITADTGIIQQELNFENCFIEKREDHYQIEDTAVYDSLISELSNEFLCDSSSFPSIDFSKHALLGLWADGGGCSINFYRTAGDERSAKKYVYTVTVQECGFCEMYGFSYNWVLVPKLPPGYSVKFQVKYIN
ncbi:MAG: hypothetical protein WD334_02265 [Chitinophagales bacterium]